MIIIQPPQRQTKKGGHFGGDGSQFGTRLSTSTAGKYFSILLTDDMGLPGKHRHPRWEVAGKFL
jgi:hypothetical protein